MAERNENKEAEAEDLEGTDGPSEDGESAAAKSDEGADEPDDESADEHEDADEPDDEGADEHEDADELEDEGADESDDRDEDEPDDEGADELEDEGADESDDRDEDAEKAAGALADELPADEQAARVAKALGLEDGAAEAEEEEAPANRAARRRERALARRKGKKKPADEGEDKRSQERDRNRRLRENLLAKRRGAAAERAAPSQAAGLAPSEMAEDVLVRTSAAVVKWLSTNKSLVGWMVFVAIVATAGALYYVHHADTSLAVSSDELLDAVMADEGRVVAEEDDQRTEEQQKLDPTKIYRTAEERSKAALEAYDKVVQEYAGSGVAILAELGRAGVLLDEQKYDEAIGAYEKVLASELAPVDDDVKARAYEGLGYAKEGKGDLDGATEEFKKLASIEPFKALGLYQQARLLMDKDRSGAKKLLVEARELAEKANIASRSGKLAAPNRWLLGAIEDDLRTIDPQAVPVDRDSLANPQAQEQLRQMLKEQGLDLPPPGLPAPGGK